MIKHNNQYSSVEEEEIISCKVLSGGSHLEAITI
jgi:hypothetical protein